MKISNRKKKRGASILLLSFFFMMVLFLIATTIYKIVPAEMHAASRASTDLRAHYVARTGIQETMGWLKWQITEFDADQQEENLPDYNSGTVAAPVYDNIIAFEAQAEGVNKFGDDEWSYDLQILPLQDSIGQKHGFQPRFYSVRSTALLNGNPVKTIDVLLKQRTFASFAFMTDEMDPQAKFVIDGKETIRGPVHTNDHFRFEVEGHVWADSDAKGYFSDIVSYAEGFAGAEDGSEWLADSPADHIANGNGGYSKVFKKDRNGLRKKGNIELPSSSANIVSEVWPLDTTANPLPTDAYGYVAHDPTDIGPGGRPKVKGGVYVGNDIDELALKLDSNGNQLIDINQWSQTTGQVVDPNRTRWIRDVNSPWGVVGQRNVPPCLVTASGGSTGGVNGGNVNDCITWTREDVYNYTGWIEVPDTRPQNIKKHFLTNVVEVTEAPASYNLEDGTTITAQVGQTLIRKRSQTFDPLAGSNGEWGPVVVEAVEVYDGQINGTLYVDGDIGGSWTGGNQGGGNGLWGIAKGSVLPEADGSINPVGADRDYLNKTVVTPLNKSIASAGDLLQFNQEKFDNNTGVNFAGTTGNKFNWTLAALDPNLTGPDPEDPTQTIPTPELSPNNDHVMGIITRDFWMKGKKDGYMNNWHKKKNGDDGYSDVYAVILAGKTESDGSTSGGFGTWYQQRDKWNDGLGKYRIFGGVIQGTTAANLGDRATRAHRSHHWASEGVGYEASLNYDIEATRQRLFPTFPEFRVIRYLERSAR